MLNAFESLPYFYLVIWCYVPQQFLLLSLRINKVVKYALAY
jgi:hypothetical protein